MSDRCARGRGGPIGRMRGDADARLAFLFRGVRDGWAPGPEARIRAARSTLSSAVRSGRSGGKNERAAVRAALGGALQPASDSAS